MSIDPKLLAQLLQELEQSRQADPQRSSVIGMPSSAQLAGEGGPGKPPPWVRFPFFPTSPWYSSNPNVGYQVRTYVTRLRSTDSDFTVGSEVTRNIQFDLPCRVIAFQGALTLTDWTTPPQINAVDFFPTEQNMGLLYRARAEYTTGDKLHTQEILGSCIMGSGAEPGEIGGHGYNIDQGASMQISITPLLAGTTIDIGVTCLEMRAPRNFNVR